MSANNLGLFFLILGTTGISIVSTISFPRNERYPGLLGLSHIHDIQRLRGVPESVQGKTKFCEHFKLFHKYGHPLCDSIYNPSIFRPYENSNRQIYPEWQKPYSRSNWFKKYVSAESHNTIIADLYDSSENSVSATQRSNTDESDITKKQNLFNYIQTISPFHELKNPSLSDTHSKSIISQSPATTNNEFDLHKTDQKISDFKIFPESSNDVPLIIQNTSNSDLPQTIFKTATEPQRNSSSAMIKENADLDESKNFFTTSKYSSKSGTIKSFEKTGETESSIVLFTDIYTKSETQNTYINKSSVVDQLEELASPSSNSVTSYSETPEPKDKYKPEEDNIQAKSTTFQKLPSIITSGATHSKDESMFSATTETVDEESSKMSTLLDDKSISSVDIQPPNNKHSKSESTIFQSSSFSATDEDISLRTESSSSENTHSTNTKNYKTEPTTTQSSPIDISVDTTSQSKLSSSSEIKSRTAETFKTKSATQNSMPSDKVTSIIFPDKITEDTTKETVSTKSSTKMQFQPKSIPQNHVIEISSIRTARIVITSMFLVIALIAVTVLAVYIFRLRRREVEYDQLMLLS